MDTGIAPNYVRVNFEPSDRLALVILNKQTGAVTQRITTADQIAAPRFQAWLRYQNVQRSEIYISMNALRSGATGRTKADVETIRHVYLDFDQNGTTAMENLMRQMELPRPNYRLSTSPGKWQVVWRVDGFTPDDAEKMQKGLARDHSADRAATDCARVLRLPGFYNHKYDPPHLVTVEPLSKSVHRPEHFPDIQKYRDGPAVNQPVHPQKRSEPGLSQSERDFAFAKRALVRGESEYAVMAAIAHFRYHEKHDPGDYAARTVRKAAAALASDHCRDVMDFDR